MIPNRGSLSSGAAPKGLFMCDGAPLREMCATLCKNMGLRHFSQAPLSLPWRSVAIAAENVLRAVAVA